MKRKIAVVGGGASGLMAAISAARSGAQVTIYERMDRVGKKILATGNGRCNLTNRYAQIQNYHGKNPHFLHSAISRFWVQETLDFFLELGIVAKEEEQGKIYPYSGQASAVLDVLRFETERLGVQTVCNFEVKKLIPKKQGFQIESYQGETAFADYVILSAGGKAAPNLGSNGSGYEICKQLGHHITKLSPSLVQLRCENTKSMQGMKMDACVRIGQKAESQGELLFTDYGLSGPPIFDLSAKRPEFPFTVSVDLMPEYSLEEIKKILAKRKHGTLEQYLIGILPKKLGQSLLKNAGFAPLSRRVDSLLEEEIQRIAYKIKHWDFTATDTLSWNNAQVTAGGVLCSEVNPSSMESKLVPGVYLTGELLDIDGDCGGFNLQWAWTSGFLAGVHAAERRMQ